MSIEAKKRNIVTRFFSGTVVPIGQQFEWLSWLLFGGFLLLSLVAVLLQFQALSLGTGENGEKLWQEYFWVAWYSAWLLLVLSIVEPLVLVFEQGHPNRLAIFLTASISLVIVFVVISIVVLAKHHSQSPQAITTLLAGLAAAAMIGVGWTVQAEVAHRTARRSHTFNVIMQSRLSSVFQEHLTKREIVFPPGRLIPPDVAEYASPLAYVKWRDRKNAELAAMQRELQKLAKKPDPVNEAGIKAKIGTLEEDLKMAPERHQALLSLRAVLNFYEFVAAGVHTNDLDEELLKKTFKSMLVQLHRDSVHVILHFQGLTPETDHAKPQVSAFKELQKLVAAWGDG